MRKNDAARTFSHIDTMRAKKKQGNQIKVSRIQKKARKDKSSVSKKLATATLKTLAETFGTAAAAVQRLERTPSNERLDLKKAPRMISALGDAVLGVAILLEEMEKQATDENLKAACRAELEKTDEVLGIMLRNFSMFVRFRAQKTRSTELLCNAIGEAIWGMENLKTLWERYEQHAGDAAFDSHCSDCFSFTLPSALLEAVKFLENHAEHHPERFLLLAREMPCWPFRVFVHKKAYEKRFDRIASQLHLGEACPIHSSKHAEYSLETPINAFLFDVLLEFCRVKGWIEFARSEQAKKVRPGESEADILEKAAGIPRSLQSFFSTAYGLGRLTKQTAPDWAEKAVIPYLELEYPDWTQIPALTEYIGKAGGKAPAKAAIKEALKSLAWPT